LEEITMTDPTTAIINTLQQAYPELPAAAIAQVVSQLLRGERAAIGGNAVALTFGEGNSFDQATIRVGDIAGGDIINVTVHLSQALDPLPVARALFASLPLDRLPAPTPDLPPTSRMLLSRNPQFVGREQDLRNLALVIADLQPTVIVSAVATGIGGIGKTSIAVEFVYRYGCYFAGGVFWIGCADPAAIASEVVACALTMGLPVAELPLDDQVAAVRRAWQEPLPRLLIFDNCEDPQLLATWIPTVGGCRVLVTARRGEWSTGSWVPIGVLARSDSITLIQTLAPHVALADADAVAEAVGDLPLALHLAGSYLARVRGHETPPQYLERLVAVEILDHPAFVGRALRAGEALPTKHEQDVARTFALSFEQLDLEDRVDRLAHHFLMCLACLAPGELVPQELLWAMLPAGSDSLDGVDALDRGILLGLVERNRDAMVRIHRLIHLYLGRSLSLTLVVDLVEDILIARTSDLNRVAYPPAMNALMPHLRWCSRAAAIRTDERMAALLNETGMALVVQGQYAAAEPLLRRALSIREMTLGSTHPTTAWSIHNLAYLMESQGQYHVAEPLYLQARTIWEATLSPDHPTIAMNLHNLAVLFRAQGRYEEAEPLAQRALTIRETVFGPSHPTTAWSLNNLAALFRVQGRYEDAEPLVQRALAIREAVFGPHHPITAWSLHNLAGVLKGRHQYGTAESCYRRALLIWEEALGSEHPTTAWGLITLADLLNEQGQWVEAEALVRRTLAIHERVLGSWHPDTARSLHLLGTILAKQYDYIWQRPSISGH
jgi:tetratricopeptide (TPR) repeat protein